VSREWPIEGNGHTTAPVIYHTNPPTSGNHNPVPAADGVYPPNGTPPVEQLVHSLEHGRIILQYRPGTAKAIIDRLVRIAEDNDAYHVLLVRNETGMTAQVAATAWGASILCRRFDDRAEQQLRDFRERYTDKAPEFIP
jgi:hypothetical protein